MMRLAWWDKSSVSTPSRSTGKAGKSRGRTATAQRRDLAALTQRRMRAVQMFRAGKRQVDVATELGVSAQTASRWHRDWLAGGSPRVRWRP